MRVRLGFALLFFCFQLVSAQTDPVSCSVSCRYVIVPTLGPHGLPGLNGTNGTNGIDGIDGKDGTNGTNGTNGIDGIDGLNGTNGTNGINGIDGKDGINGTNGTNGINGINGIDGKDGINGTNGIDGKDATFDSTATYTGLKLQSPTLTGSMGIENGASISFKSTDSLNPPFVETKDLGRYYVRNFKTPWYGMMGESTMPLARVGRVMTLTIPPFTSYMSYLNPPMTAMSLEPHERPTLEVNSWVMIGLRIGTDPEILVSARLTLETGSSGRLIWNIASTYVGSAAVVRILGTSIQWIASY